MSGAVRPTSQTTSGVAGVKRVIGYAMRIVAFRPEHVADPPTLARMLNELQDQVKNATDVPNSLPFAGGKWVRNLSFASGTSQAVAHGLGRAYRGFLATRIQASGDAYPFEVALHAGESATQVVRLQTAANATIDLLVF